MSLTKYEPTNFMRKMQSDLDDFFNLSGYRMVPSLFDQPTPSFTGDWRPTIDVKESKKQFTVTVEVPGVDPKDIEVTTEDDCLLIKGERKEEKVEEDEGHHLKECSYGMFERRLRMPVTADLGKVSAKGKHGVLNIAIAKKKGAKTNRIKIQSS